MNQERLDEFQIVSLPPHTAQAVRKNFFHSREKCI